MKILHLDSGDTFRGGQQQVLFLLRALAQRGHCPILAVPPASPLSNQVSPLRIQIETLPMKGLSRFLGVRRLRHLLKELRPEIVHCHDGRVHGMAYLAARSLALPLVVARRVAFPINRNFFSRRKYLFPQQRYIAVSKFIRDLMIHNGVPPSQIDVVYDGLEPDSSPAPLSRPDFERDKSAFVIGAFCALEYEKGLDLLIEAIRRLHSGKPSVQCIIAGSGRLQRPLQNLVHRHGLADVVRITSPPTSAAQFVRTLDLFVLPSRLEGLGSILLVAMQAGTPVLASAAGGIPEIVEDAKTGFLFEKENPKALAGALMRLAQDRKLLNSVVEPAARKVAEEFSIERMTSGTLRTYQLLLDAHRPIP